MILVLEVYESVSTGCSTTIAVLISFLLSGLFQLYYFRPLRKQQCTPEGEQNEYLGGVCWLLFEPLSMVMSWVTKYYLLFICIN